MEWLCRYCCSAMANHPDADSNRRAAPAPTSAMIAPLGGHLFRSGRRRLLALFIRQRNRRYYRFLLYRCRNSYLEAACVTGFIPNRMTSPAESVIKVMDLDPFMKVALGPSFGAMNVTGTSARAHSSGHQPQPLAAAAVRTQNVNAAVALRISMCSLGCAAASRASIPGCNMGLNVSARRINFSNCVCVCAAVTSGAGKANASAYTGVARRFT